ncbi:Leucine zipper homeobox-associated protein [Dioscorea alata]|uniref:Leucine zipper homeobox-associated protein n=1 Tax=Dioscorea alata TaxID=55571 RepID=A0ACB7WJG0_DIOAL|nr:Leucine zipper homeobox-associated protein [Dioscorea alata]
MGEEACNIELGLAIGGNDYLRPKQVLKEVIQEDINTIKSWRWKPKIEKYEDSDHGNEKHGMRKKLKLSHDQLASLEACFRAHNILNPAQKQDLARELHLKPRQVEVWFQNRRARTKLKKAEMDCEFLKRSCESLNNENKRLKREIQELRSGKHRTSPFFFPTMISAVCPACERMKKEPSSSSSMAC